MNHVKNADTTFRIIHISVDITYLSVHLPLSHCFRSSSAAGLLRTLSSVFIVCNRARSGPAEQNLDTIF